MTLWQTIHVLKNSYLYMYFIYFLRKWTINNNNFCQVEQCVVPHFDVHLYSSIFFFPLMASYSSKYFQYCSTTFSQNTFLIDFVNFICFKSPLGFVLKSLHSFQLLLRRPKRWRHYNNSTFKIVTKLAIKYLKVFLQPTHFMSK